MFRFKDVKRVFFIGVTICIGKILVDKYLDVRFSEITNSIINITKK